MHVPCAAATCVAALKLQKPVLCQLDRNTDMQSLGGRQPASAAIELAVASTGTITSLRSVQLCEWQRRLLHGGLRACVYSAALVLVLPVWRCSCCPSATTLACCPFSNPDVRFPTPDVRFPTLTFDFRT